MDSETRRVGLRSVAAAIGMFGAGFLVVAGGIHLAMARPLALYAAMRSEKLALMGEWRGRALSAGFGSSHVHYGFDPRAFDAAMAGTGEATRTINLAVAGGSQAEQRAMALGFVDGLGSSFARSQACFVLLELNAGANFTREHLVHPRAINLYDWETMRFVLRLSSPAMGVEQRVGRGGFAVLAMAMHYTNVGMLSSWALPAQLDEKQSRAETMEDRRGLIVEDRRVGVLEELRGIEARAPRLPVVTRGVVLEGNRELADELQARGDARVYVVYLVMPKLADLAVRVEYPESLAGGRGAMPIVNLARPDVYPELYKPELWLDDAHLDEAGARMATTLLAEALKRWYGVHGQPESCGR